MKATFVPDQITPYEPEPLAAALRAACIALPDVGRDPGDAAIAVFLAQIGLETGRGKACHGFDFGNVKASDTYGGQFSCFRCNEIIHGKVEWFSPDTGGFSVPPGHPQTRFRAYADTPETKAAGLAPALSRAALEYIAFLGRAGSRYHSAWLRALAGDPAGYVHELKRHGYFTASEDPYRKAVVSLCHTYAPAVKASHELDHVDPGIDHQVDDSTTHSPLGDEDLEHRLQLLELDPDWDAMRQERDQQIKDQGGI